MTRFDRARSWLPRGHTLDAAAFAERHRTVSILLALHVPALLAFGVFMGEEITHVVAEVAFAAVLLGIAQLKQLPRRWQGILVSGGLVWCSAIAVHFSGGMIEAHFHFFVILGFIALYQDWAAFGWAIVFTALSHGLGSTLAADLMFNHDAAIERPWTWALIHAGMVLFAATGQIIGWRHAEMAQDRAMELNTELLREQASRQASFSRIYVNLARRNQSLLHRQLSTIDDLEQREEDPDNLRRLFVLDHLTTRIRRNGESLLVMAGEDSPRRWHEPIALGDIARAAASEIEQFERVDVRIADPVEIHGGAVVDVTHLLAELIENAAEYSAPSSEVLIGGYATTHGAVVTIEDRGIGMSADDLAAANATLLDPPELDEDVVRHLGFQVVGRLAAKRGLRVQLRPTDGGGTTAVVELPADIIAGGLPEEPEPETSAPTPPATPAPAPVAATAPVAHQQAPVSAPAPAPTPAPVAAAPVPSAVASDPTPAPVVEQPSATPASPPAPVADGPAPLLFSAKTPPPPTRTAPAEPTPQRAAAVPAPVTPPEPAAAPAPVAPVAAAPVTPTPVAPVAAAPVAPTPVAPTPVAPMAADPAVPTDPQAPRPVNGHALDDSDALELAAALEATSFARPSSPDGHGSNGTNGTNGSTPSPAGTNGGGPATTNGSNGQPVSAPVAAPLGEGDRPSLPRRTPAASLAPQLRDGTGAGPESEPLSPPEARRALSAFQASARAGREAADHEHGENHR
jgi:signal transduction histidine kinase